MTPSAVKRNTAGPGPKKNSRTGTEQVADTARRLSAFFSEMKAIPGLVDDPSARVADTCRRIPEEMRTGVIRVAVVGTIKSGKSTLVNALAGKELLRRGAGVVTAMVTRVRPGRTTAATVCLKSWDEVNRDLEKALMYYDEGNAGNPEAETYPFDLRRRKDRDRLARLLDRLNRDDRVQSGSLLPAFVRIRQALDGYDRVCSRVAADPVCLRFEADRFLEHQMFTGDSAVAFYAEDVLVEDPDLTWKAGTEVTDCQGSDAVDPEHLIRIQDYLVKSHLILYVISSRMGVREADLSFLGIIHEMGLSSLVTVVVNIDLGEHSDTQDLEKVLLQIRRDVGDFSGDLPLFSFSGLERLYSQMTPSPTEDVRRRMHLWEGQPDLMQRSHQGWERFQTHLTAQLADHRADLLVRGPVRRMETAAGVARSRIRLFQDTFDRAERSGRDAMEHLHRVRERAKTQAQMIAASCRSTENRLQADIQRRLNQIFDPDNGRMIRELRVFIKAYDWPLPVDDDRIAVSGAGPTLHHRFQQFRTDLDRFMARRFTPAVMAMIQAAEKEIESEFQALGSTCRVKSQDLPRGIIDGDAHPETRLKSLEGADPLMVELPMIKGILGLAPPRAGLVTTYSARIRVDALTRLGLHSLLGLVARLTRKPFVSPVIQALDQGCRTMKHEALRGVEAHMRVCRDHLEHAYFTPLIQAVGRNAEERLLAVCTASEHTLDQMEQLAGKDQEEKRRHLAQLVRLAARLDEVEAALGRQ